MTNFEYYKEQLKELAGAKIGVFNGEPNRCVGRKCSECDLDECNQERYSDNCEFALTQWYVDEHVEKHTITKKERAFLEICKPECYIARDDKTDELYLFKSKPIKNNDYWSCSVGSCVNVSSMITKSVLIFDGIDRPFPFIKWEDKEPWKVEDLLKLEVKG